jgi:hypothetical protein
LSDFLKAVREFIMCQSKMASMAISDDSGMIAEETSK